MISVEQIHAILDDARFGDRITVTRSNGGELTATVSGPVLAAPDVSRAVGIDLLDGEPHVIRREDGEVFGQIVDIKVEIGPYDNGHGDPGGLV